jgi:hypothetical protein
MGNGQVSTPTLLHPPPQPATLGGFAHGSLRLSAVSPTAACDSRQFRPRQPATLGSFTHGSLRLSAVLLVHARTPLT